MSISKGIEHKPNPVRFQAEFWSIYWQQWMSVGRFNDSEKAINTCLAHGDGDKDARVFDLSLGRTIWLNGRYV